MFKKLFEKLFAVDDLRSSLEISHDGLEWENRHRDKSIVVFGFDHATGEEITSVIGPGEKLKFPEGCSVRHAKFE